MYMLIFYISKILILPIFYTNDDYFNQSSIKTTYAAME